MNNKPNKFPAEVRERAIGLVQECRANYASLWAACESIAPKMGCSVSTLKLKFPQITGGYLTLGR
ncbi:hypothetical protein EDF71_1311 [Comamonas sp. JUb58]|nr:hypothetical protein EDF71_1311 [Comamonas sp. JUb58]